MINNQSFSNNTNNKQNEENTKRTIFESLSFSSGLVGYEGRLLVNPNYSIFYYSTEWLGDQPLNKEKPERPLLNLTNGVLSQDAKKRMRNAINWLLALSDWKTAIHPITQKEFKWLINFFTLTLPSSQTYSQKGKIKFYHSDKEITRYCLNQLLVELSRDFKMNLYVWKAERQDNFNLHYHVMTNVWIDYSELRHRWNRIINKGKVGSKRKLDYVDRYKKKQEFFYKDGFRVREDLLQPTKKRPNGWETNDQLNAYNEEMKKPSFERWNNPNSTDIHSVNKIHNLAGYVSEYMVKNELTESEKDEYLGLIEQINNFRLNIKGAEDNIKVFKAEKMPRQYIKNEETRIKGAKKMIKALEKDLEKFKTKIIDGDIWGCSRFLKLKCLINPIEIINDEQTQKSKLIESETLSMLNTAPKVEPLVQKKLNKETGEIETTASALAYATIIKHSPKELKRLGYKEISKQYQDFINEKKEILKHG